MKKDLDIRDLLPGEKPYFYMKGNKVIEDQGERNDRLL